MAEHSNTDTLEADNELDPNSLPFIDPERKFRKDENVFLILIVLLIIACMYMTSVIDKDFFK